MKKAKVLVPALVLFAGVLTLTSTSSAKMEYSKKEKTACTTCHVKNGSKELNDTGKKYKDTGKLEKK